MVAFRILVLNPLLFFILAAVIFNYRQLAGADEALMKQECQHEDHMSDLCMRCLEAYPESETADRLGIAMIVVTKCLMSQSTTLGSNMTSLAATASNSVKTALNNCSNLYMSAGKELTEAGEKLKTRDSDSAYNSVFNALNYQENCRSSINEIGNWSFPPTVSFDMNIYDDLTDVAVKLIDKINLPI